MLEEALSYPLAGEETVKTFVIGGLCSFFAALVVPAILVVGYNVRIIRQVSHGDTGVPPVFEDWGELVVDGLAGMVIGFVYMLAGLLLYVAVSMVGLTLLALTSNAGRESAGAVSDVTSVVFFLPMLVGFVGFLVVLYPAPAGMAAYAYTGELTAAFSPSTMRTVGTSRSYVVAVLLALLVGWMTQTVSYMAIFTIVGILAVPFIGFFGNVAGAYLIGAGVAGTPLVSEPPEQESPAGERAV